MRQTYFAVVAVCALAAIALVSHPTRAADEPKAGAADKPADKAAADKQTITGVLMDLQCSGSYLKKDDPEKAALKHTKDCATEDECAKSGYGVIHDGKKLLKFDDKGNQLAKEYLEKTKKEDNLKVKVEGKVDGDKIAVTAISDAS